MQLFFWRKNKLIDEFAFQLADELYSTINPEMAQEYIDQQAASSKKSDEKKYEKLRQKVTRTLNNDIMRIQQFRELHALGIYGKARLHLTFTERLKELGYPATVAEEINKLLLIRTP
jgi:hypothetical protein